MAMPMLSGPGSIGVVMGLAATADHFFLTSAWYRNRRARPHRLSLLVLEAHSSSASAPARSGRDQPYFPIPDPAIAVQLVWNGVADFRS